MKQRDALAGTHDAHLGASQRVKVIEIADYTEMEDLMKLRTALIFAVAFMPLGLSAWSQEVPKWEISADYTYSHFAAIDYQSANYFYGQTYNLNGGGGGVQYNFSRLVGIKAEFQGYGSQTKLVRIPP